MKKKHLYLIVLSFFLLGYTLTILSFHYCGEIPSSNPKLYGASLAMYVIAIVFTAIFGHPRGKPINKIKF